MMGEAPASRFAPLQKGRGQREDKQEHVKYLATLTVVFVVLVGSALLVLVADTTQRQLLQQPFTYYSASEAKVLHENDLSSLLGSSPPLAAAANPRSDIAVLDNDQDHDGNYNGVADPLAGGLALVSAVLVIGVGVVALIGGRPLLTLCEPLKLSSICSPVLKRPG